MQLFYLILAHKDFHLLERQIAALDHPHTRFFIHLDKKADLQEFRRCNFTNNDRVVVLQTRLSISWGGFNMVQATLLLLNRAMKEEEQGYFILLSGQDFPIKSAHHIYQSLQRNYGSEYLEYFSMPYSGWNLNGGLDRIRYYWFVDDLEKEGSEYLFTLQLQGQKVRSYFDEIRPFGGSQWWCITSECASYVLQFIRKNKAYLTFYRHCYIPDEMFFQTIILNSDLKEQVVNDNLRYIDWNTGPQYPKLLTMNDFPSLKASEKLWARKFNGDNGVSVINQIEEQLLR